MALVKINSALNHWAIFNQSGTATQFWSRITSGANISNDVLRLEQTPFPQASWAAPIDMGRDTGNARARDNDRLILAKNSEFRLALSGVEYVQVASGFTVDLVQAGVGGFTTDGSVRNLSANVGNHTIVYENAVRDSKVFLGNGYDRVTLATNPDAVDQGQDTYWITRRLADNSVISYSLYSGNTIQLAGGGLGMNAIPSRGNYGEIEIMDFRDRNNGLRQFRPGNDTIADAGARLGFDNIDLSDFGQDNYTDSFLHASFGSINLTSKNVFSGAAVIQDWFDDEATAQEGAANQQSAALRWQTTSFSDADHNHDLVVSQQTDAIDGHLRVYVRNETSAAYNRFNEVFLGTSASEVVTRTGASTSGNGLTNSTQNVALYGFGGNDILTAGAGSDYLFGGTSTFTTIPTVLTGNQITGGDGADFFGVGNISVGQDGDNLMTTNFSARLSGDAPASNTQTGQLARVDASDAADLATRVGTDRIQDWTSGSDSLRVLANGTAIIEGLGTANGLGGAYGVDLIGGDAERIDISGVRVRNEGKIVARGFDGHDTLIGSTGDDWLYGNGGINRYQLSEGGNDRVYVDQFANASSKHIVNSFATSAAVASDTDLVMLNKRIVDAFFAAGANRAASTQDSLGNFIRSTSYDPSLDYLHDNFYNPAIVTTSDSHNSADGLKLFENGPSGADGTTSSIGVGMIATGYALLAIPFVGPILAAPLIAAGTILQLTPTQAHLNARYDGRADGYLNVITQNAGSEGDGSLLRPTTSVNTDDSPAFLSFFERPDAGDGFIPVVEFTQQAGQGVYGFFALHSDTETFVYLVVSRDNLVEETETFLIAQINGLLSATDFGIYDGESDVYNFGTIPAVVLKDPRIITVFEQGDPINNNAEDDGRITNLEDPVAVMGTVAGGIAATATFRLYDGATKIFEGQAGTTGGPVTLTFDGTFFSFIDSRALGAIVRNTTNAVSGDDTYVLADDRVIYTVELVDPETGVPTRDTTDPITVTGGNVTIDGGAGADILLLIETSDFVNNASDTKIVGFETIVLAGSASGNPPVSTAISVDLSRQTEGFQIASGETGDTIIGSRGADTITSGGGADSINGFDGNDTVVYTNSYQQNADGSFVLVGGNRVLVTAAGDQLDADATVIGGQGFDTIQIDGETQIVTLGDALFDKVTQFEGLALTGTGAQNVTLGTNTNAAFASGITVTTVAAATSLNLQGSASTVSVSATGTNNADTIVGGTVADTLIGGSGNDTITGGAGADNISGGDGDDVFIIAAAADHAAGETIKGGNNTDVIRFTSTAGGTLTLTNEVNVEEARIADATGDATGTTAESINAAAAVGAIALYGNSGANQLTGNAEANVINGGGGADNIDGGDGNDTISFGSGSAANVTVTGGAGDDQIDEDGTGSGNDSLIGGTGNDSIWGGEGNDFIDGGNDNDSLEGEGGNDTIIGGGGNDDLIGGAGTNVIWGGQGQDTVTASTAGAVNKIIIVGDLASYAADPAKMNLINTTLDTLLGFDNADVTTAYTTDVATGETIAFDVAGDDEIHAFGVVDLSNVTITGAFTVYTYSTLTMTLAQLSLAKQINVVGPSSHTIIITGNDGSALAVDVQQAAVDAWLDANGKQLGFSGANGPVRVGVGGLVIPFTANGNAYTAEDIAPPFDSRNGLGLPVGNPIGANPNFSNLLFDKDMNGFDDPLTIDKRHFTIDTNDRFMNAQFVSVFTPGQTFLSVPDTIIGSGDNQVHNREFEVYYGDYDVRTGVFSVTGLPGSGRTTYTLILYDNDTTTKVEFIEGIVLANWMQEDTWLLTGDGTPNARLSAPVMADGGVYDSTFGTDFADTLSGTGSGKVDYLYGRNDDDTISGDGGGDFIIAGSGNDLITPGAGENIVDLGDDTFDANFGDGDDDILVINAVVDVSSDSGRFVTAGDGNDTGQDILFNFEFARDTIRVVATAVASFNHGTDTGMGTAGASDNGNAASFEQTTGYIDLNGNGTVGTGDIAVSFRNLQPGDTFQSRIQYVLTGTSSGDNITSGDLNDTITGGQGADTLNGGAGSDTIIINGTADIASGENYDGGANTDTLRVTADTNFAGVTTIVRIENIEAAAAVDLTFTAAQLTGQTIAINGTGNNGGESLTINGTASGETINLGGLTVDTDDISGALIDALGGNDTIVSTNGNDTIIGGAGADTIAPAALNGTGDLTIIINGTADIAAGESYDGGNGTGGAADYDRILVTADTNFAGVTSIVRIENIVAAAGVDLTFDASLLTGQTIAIDGTGDNGGETFTVNGTALGETIDLGGLTIDTNDISGALIDAGDGNDSVIGTNGNDTILGGLGDDTLVGGAGRDSLVGGDGADVYKFNLNSDTTTNDIISEMDVIDGFSITEDTLDLSAFGTLSAGPTATVDPNDTDSYVVQWTSGGVTNYVYLKDTGVTGGLTLGTSGGIATATATSPTGLGLTLVSVSSGGITTQGNGPHRAFFTEGDQAPVRNNELTYHTQSTNIGASTNYTFTLANISAGSGTLDRRGLIAIQATNTLLNTFLDARVYVGGETATSDLIIANLGAANLGAAGTVTINYAIIYGQGGDDDITSTTGADYVFGGAGIDTIYSPGGADYIEGGDGNDLISWANAAGGAGVTVYGGAGDDNIDPGSDFRNDSVFGDAGNDTIYGAGGNDTISGGADNDVLYGEGGDDVIIGGAGVDILIGGEQIGSAIPGDPGNARAGSGSDTFVFTSGDTGITVATADRIHDFALDDRLDLSAMNSFASLDGAGLGNQTEATAFGHGSGSLAGGGTRDGFIVYNVNGSGNSYVFIDEDGNGSLNAGDTFVILSGFNIALPLENIV